jgi:hypothetical protein
MKYIPYLYIWYATPSQHSDNPTRWYNVSVSQLELDQKTSDMFCHGKLSDPADTVALLYELNGKLDSEP